MFLTLAIIATISYALNSVWLAPLARTHNPFKVTAYRGLALFISMSPVLWFVPSVEFEKLNSVFFFNILLTCAITFLGNVCAYRAQKYLPVGIALALCLSFSGLMTMAIGVLFLNDQITYLQLILAIVIFIETIIMGLVSSNTNFSEINITKGLIYSFGFGVFLGIGYSLVSILSKDKNPLLIGYCWESGIGLLGILFIFIRDKKESISPKREFKSFLLIGLASLPTILGTSCYALASTMGPLGILGAILSTMGAFGAIFGYIFLKEKLSLKQWILTLVIAMTLVALKVTSA